MENRPGFAKHQLMSAGRSGDYNTALLNTEIPKAIIRVSDERWIKGKFKGVKIKDSDKSYVKWMLENREMPKSHEVLVRNILKTMK